MSEVGKRGEQVLDFGHRMYNRRLREPVFRERWEEVQVKQLDGLLELKRVMYQESNHLCSFVSLLSCYRLLARLSMCGASVSLPRTMAAEL